MTHLTFDEISELASRGVASSDANEPHIDACAECRDTLRKVRDLLAASRALPSEIEPPREAWSALRARIAAERRGTTPVLPWWRHRGARLAMAAATVMFAAGLAMMTRPVRKGKALSPDYAIVATPVMPVAVVAVEKNYAGTITQLRDALAAQGSTLSPSTLRIVARSLATIDSAIAEARDALASDPGNQALVDILSASYQHKVDLLQRATELSSSL